MKLTSFDCAILQTKHIFIISHSVSPSLCSPQSRQIILRIARGVRQPIVWELSE